MRLIGKMGIVSAMVGLGLPGLVVAGESPEAFDAGSMGPQSVSYVESMKDDLSWKFEWNDGFALSSSDRAFKLKFGGRIMLDAGVFALHGGLKNDFRGLGIGARHGSGVEIRRARIFFSGDLYERVFFKTELDFAGDSDDVPKFNDVYLGLRNVGPLNAIMVGHFKEPLSLQEATSSKYMTFMERGLTSTFFPGRNVGIMIDGKSAEHRVFWQLGAFRETNDQGQGFDSWGEQRWDVAGRLAVTPVYSETGDHVLHLGVGYVHRFLSGNRSVERLRLRARPVAHLAQYFADSESLAAFQADIVNFELAYVRGGFSFQAELTKTWIEGAGGLDDLEFRSAYAFASYFLTGEQREYLLGKGKFGRVKPIHDFDPSRGHWGALEVALRYSYLDLVDHSIDGGELWEVTAGLNWYLFPNVRWMLNYVHTEVEDRFATSADSPGGFIDGAAEVVEMRIQLDF